MELETDDYDYTKPVEASDADAREDFITKYCGPMPDAVLIFDLMLVDQQVVYHQAGRHCAHYQMKDVHSFDKYKRAVVRAKQEFITEHLGDTTLDADLLLKHLVLGDRLVFVPGDHEPGGRSPLPLGLYVLQLRDIDD